MGRLTGSAAFNFEISSVEMKGKEFIASIVFYLLPFCATTAVNPSSFIIAPPYIRREDLFSRRTSLQKWQATH
jgi:hypothetical protein